MPIQNANILIGVSGSVAAIRVPRIVNALIDRGANVKVVCTTSALAFLEAEESMPAGTTILTNEEEWKDWKKLSDPVLHIELRKWAQLFLIAPLSANTLAKVANGMCDNLLTCVARAWPLQAQRASNPSKPLIVAPAMNTMMWEHPITQSHLSSVRDFGIAIIPPISKKLACGDTGCGAMAEVPSIVQHVVDQMASAQD